MVQKQRRQLAMRLLGSGERGQLEKRVQGQKDAQINNVK